MQDEWNDNLERDLTKTMPIFIRPTQEHEDIKRSLKALTQLAARPELHRFTLGRDMHVDKYINLFEGITPEIESQFDFFNEAQRVSVFIVLSGVNMH